jgi:hypothetical protein
MSFTSLKKEELIYAADFANIELTENATKAEIIAALEEAGFTWNNYKKFVQADGGQVEEDSPVAEANIQFDQMVLLKMDRKNPTFEILGRRFTSRQPFQVMTADEAQQIIDLVEPMGGGFRIATPAEAKNYFG